MLLLAVTITTLMRASAGALCCALGCAKKGTQEWVTHIWLFSVSVLERSWRRRVRMSERGGINYVIDCKYQIVSSFLSHSNIFP